MGQTGVVKLHILCLWLLSPLLMLLEVLNVNFQICGKYLGLISGVLFMYPKTIMSHPIPDDVIHCQTVMTYHQMLKFWGYISYEKIFTWNFRIPRLIYFFTYTGTKCKRSSVN